MPKSILSLVYREFLNSALAGIAVTEVATSILALISSGISAADAVDAYRTR